MSGRLPKFCNPRLAAMIPAIAAVAANTRSVMVLRFSQIVPTKNLNQNVYVFAGITFGISPNGLLQLNLLKSQ